MYGIQSKEKPGRKYLYFANFFFNFFFVSGTYCECNFQTKPTLPAHCVTRRPSWFCSLQLLSCLLPSDQTRQHYLCSRRVFLPFKHVDHEKRKTQKIVYTAKTSKVRVLLFFVIPCGFHTWYICILFPKLFSQ